jgi:hypothetical protein
VEAVNEIGYWKIVGEPFAAMPKGFKVFVKLALQLGTTRYTS